MQTVVHSDVGWGVRVALIHTHESVHPNLIVRNECSLSQSCVYRSLGERPHCVTRDSERDDIRCIHEPRVGSVEEGIGRASCRERVFGYV